MASSPGRRGRRGRHKSKQKCSVPPSHTNTDVPLKYIHRKGGNAFFVWVHYIGEVLWWIWEHLFVTETNLQHELDDLQAEAENPTIPNPLPEPLRVQVTEMNKKKLTLKVEKPSTVGEEEEESLKYDEPLSADIEVVHSQVIPDLHGILKQRSVSESSEDIWSQSSSSPSSLSPRDDACSKKSVSFSERVDKTSYKQNSAVTSMKTALKSKRRRARKREERQGRQRHNSFGSESSSGTEELEQRSVSDSEISGDTVDSQKVFEKIIEVDFQTSEYGNEAIGSLATERVDVKVSEKDVTTIEGEKNAEIIGDVIRETETFDKCEVKNGEMTSVSVENEVHDSDDLTPDEELPVIAKVIFNDLGAKDASKKSIQKADTDINSGDSLKDGERTSLDDGYISSSPGMVNLQKSEKGETNGDTGIEKEEPSKKDSSTETCLNWSDASGDAKNEHRTQCAFTFTNPVIFELDID